MGKISPKALVLLDDQRRIESHGEHCESAMTEEISIHQLSSGEDGKKGIHNPNTHSL